jgi:hypothetical protein
VRLEDDLRESVAIRSVAHARNERIRVVSMAMVLPFQMDPSGVRGQGSCFIVLRSDRSKGEQLEAGPWAGSYRRK